MIARFFFLATIVLSALLVGCAGNPVVGSVGGQAVYRTNHGAVAIGGTGTNAVPRAAYNLGQPVDSNLSPETCSAGYRLVPGMGWQCMGGYAPPARAAGRVGVTKIPSRCDFGDGVVAYTYEGRTGCDKIAAKTSQNVAATSAPASSKKPAYCPVTWNGDTKNVINRERRAAYCGELTRDLSAGKLSWNSLEVVN